MTNFDPVSGPSRGPVCSPFGVAIVLFVVSLTLTMNASCSDVDGLFSYFVDRQTDFAALHVGVHGADRKAVIEAMGTPTHDSVKNMAGIEMEILKFRDRKMVYRFVLLGGKVWSKSATTLNSRKED